MKVRNYVRFWRQKIGLPWVVVVWKAAFFMLKKLQPNFSEYENWEEDAYQSVFELKMRRWEMEDQK